MIFRGLEVDVPRTNITNPSMRQGPGYLLVQHHYVPDANDTVQLVCNKIISVFNYSIRDPGLRNTLSRCKEYVFKKS